MQFPWRSLHESARRLVSVWLPVGVLCLMAVNAAVFLAQCCWPGLRAGQLEQAGALSLSGLQAGNFRQPLTCLFLHPDWPSWAATMLLLWSGGRRLEAVVGLRHVLALYLIGGTAGAFGQLAVNWLGRLHDGRAIASCLGAAPAALAIFVAYARIMPEAFIAAPWSMPLRIKARHLALGVAAGSAGLMAWDFRSGPLAQPAASWLIGSAVGCLYSWQLGFGHRSPAREESPSRSDAAISLIHASPVEIDCSLPQRQIPATATKTSALTANATVTSARFTESERRMSARQYITERIDPILDKICTQGIGSLTDEERAVLEKGREKILQNH